MKTNHSYRRLRMLAAAIAVAGYGIAFGPFNLQGSAAAVTDLVGPAAAIAVDVSVNFGDVRQTIDGFGASDAWNDNSPRPAFTDAESDLFFSTQNGIGLSYLRIAIEAKGKDSASISIAQRAAARGARVWAAPWSAPGSWKDNNDENNGGHLCADAGQGICTGSRYDDWANRLAGFVSLMKANGVDLYGLSVQNEPDWTASYSSMLYTDREMVDFVKLLGPRLASLSPRPKLMVGEFANWGNIWSLANAIESDPVAAAYTDIYGVHQYFGTSHYQAGHSRPLWQTEMSSFESFDPGIDNAINVSGWINDALTNGNANAWHYWWLRGLNEDNEGLVGHDSDIFAMTKRVFVMGNYSKFVRPGWVRLGTSGSASGMDTVAFKNPSTGAFAVVVTNHGSTAPLSVGISGGTVTSQITPYQTYDDGSGNVTIGTHGNLEQRSAIAVNAGTFTATVPHGVTTFVGVATTAQVTAPGGFTKVAPANGTAGQATSLTLSWGAPGATDYEYCVDTTNDNACGAWTSTGNATSVVISGLSAGTSYYWQVRASNARGTTYANDSSAAFWGFTTQFAEPLVTTNPATGITTRTGATLNGSVNPNGVSTEAWFEYGTSTAYESFVWATPSLGFETSPVAVSARLTGLTCGATYHFNLVGRSMNGTTSGADATFVACDSVTATNQRGPGSDFDGDRRADLTTYRPSTGEWSVLKSAAGFASSSVFAWGLPGDVPVPGDYDGDGRLDLAIYRPTTGGWWISWSRTNFATYDVYWWGLPGDVPMPADFDGDGKTDLAIYRPTTGGWWISRSTTDFSAYSLYAWGLTGDVPVLGDYDGDGKTDPAIYRPTTGEWWILKSSTNYTDYVTYGWGLVGDVPVPADYDGDGRADIAVYRPTTGEWWILESSTNFVAYSVYGWGLDTDLPVPADYDGDGAADIAVFRPSTGEWWILESSTGFASSVTYN